MSDTPTPAPAPDAGRGDSADAAGAPPGLGPAARQLGEDALAVGRAAWDSLRGVRTLLAADLALSRSAIGLTLAYAGIAIALGASAWLLLMALMVVALHATGLGWLASVAIPCVLSLLGTLFFAWRAMRVFRDTRLEATRRQLARIGRDARHAGAAPSTPERADAHDGAAPTMDAAR